MKQQGLTYFQGFLPLYQFLIKLEEKGWKRSKTQYFLDFQKIKTEKTEASVQLIKEAYIFEEKLLRYDLTIPWKRFIEDRTNLPSTIRRYEIGEVFRNGPRKGNRYRNFTQFDLEICSKKGYFTEELLDTVHQFFKELKIDCVLRVNDYSQLEEFSFKEKQELDIYSKKKKISPLLLKRYNDKKLKKFEIDTSFPYVFDPFLFRGQGIYERAVFEGNIKGETGSLIGGGEYMIGEHYCTGISIGFDQIIPFFSKQVALP
jgi:histidyl-tRNA synthetase